LKDSINFYNQWKAELENDAGQGEASNPVNSNVQMMEIETPIQSEEDSFEKEFNGYFDL
jgi:hypothetical protein